VNDLLPMIERIAPGIPNARWLAIRLLDGDYRVQQALQNGELAQLVARQQQADLRFSQKIALEGAQ
jgi:GTP-binding protein